MDTILNAPETQDEGVWKYEHLRQFCMELNGLAVKLQVWWPTGLWIRIRINFPSRNQEGQIWIKYQEKSKEIATVVIVILLIKKFG